MFILAIYWAHLAQFPIGLYILPSVIYFFFLIEQSYLRIY